MGNISHQPIIYNIRVKSVDANYPQLDPRKVYSLLIRYNILRNKK